MFSKIILIIYIFRAILILSSSMFLFMINFFDKLSLTNITHVASIFSLLVAVGSYWFNVSSKYKDKKLILENTTIELKRNIEFIKIFEEYWVQSALGTVKHVDSFKYFYLEKSLSCVGNFDLRKKIFGLINKCKTFEKIIDLFEAGEKKDNTAEEGKELREKIEEFIKLSEDILGELNNK